MNGAKRRWTLFSLVPLGWFLLPARGSLEIDPVRIVHDPVADRICDGGVAEVIMPFRDGQLAGHDGRFQAVPILHDLRHVAAFVLAHADQPPVIDDEDVDSRDPCQRAGLHVFLLQKTFKADAALSGSDDS